MRLYCTRPKPHYLTMELDNKEFIFGTSVSEATGCASDKDSMVADFAGHTTSSITFRLKLARPQVNACSLISECA